MGALDRGVAPWHCPCHEHLSIECAPFHSGRSRLSPTLKQTPRRVEKPWGHELIWAETEEYVGKTLHIRAGEALSLQYHEQKDETMS